MIRWTPTTRVASERPAPRVLVVDDDATFRASLARWVARWGAGVETAYSGPSALAALAHGGVDLMILDMHMAPMDGSEVLAAMVAQRTGLQRIGSHERGEALRIASRNQPRVARRKRPKARPPGRRGVTSWRAGQ